MKTKNYLSNTIKLLKLDKRDISTIYLYAIASGLISLVIPLGVQAIIGFVMASQLSTSLVLLISLVVLATFLYGFFQINQLKMTEKIKQKIFVRFSLTIDQKLSKLNIQKNRSYNLSELMNRFFDTLTFQKSMSKLLIDIPTSTIQIFLGLLLLAFYHPLFILFGLFLLMTLYILLRYTGKQGMATSIKESSHKYELAYWLEEQAQHIKDIQSSNYSHMKEEKTNRILTNYIEARTDHFKILNLQYWSLTLFKVVLTAAMLIVGTYLLLEQLINIGQFVAAEIVIILLLSAIEKMIFGLDNAYDLLTSTKKLFDVFDLPENAEMKVLENIPDSIQHFESEHITILSEDNIPLLQDISFDLQPGDICLITGVSGSGKSTLINLLAGVYTNYKGRLSVDDYILGTPAGYWPKHFISTLFKDSGLLETTILENITRGQPYPQSKVFSLAKELGFHDTISELPEGYQTVLEAHKNNVPSAVRKMILILRTFIDDRPIYVLEAPLQDLTASQIKCVLAYWKEHAKNKIILYTDDTMKTEGAASKILHLQNKFSQFITIK